MSKNNKTAWLILLFFILNMPGGMARAEDAIDRSQFQSILILELKDVEEVPAGGEFFLPLVIRSYSDHPAFDVRFEIKLLDQQGKPYETLAPFSFKNSGDQERVIEKIEGNDLYSLNIPFVVSADALERDYRLRVNLIGKNVFFEETVRSSATITVPVGYGSLVPRINVKEVKFTPAEPNLKEPFELALFLENGSQIDVRDLTVELDGLDNFAVVDLTNIRTLNTISANALSGAVRFNLEATETRRNNQVKIITTYHYRGNNTETKTETLNLPLEAAGAATSDPQIKITSFRAVPTEPGKYFSLNITVANKGETEAREVKLTLDGDALLFPVDATNLIYIDRLAPGEEREIYLDMGMSAKDNLDVYQLTTTLKYVDPWNTGFSTGETLSITARTLGVSDASAGIPRVIIGKYTLSSPTVLAGDTVTLNLHIQNTSSEQVNNVKVSLGVVQTDEGRSTVFSPVDSSHTFYLPRINPGATLVHSIDLFVDPASTAKTYVVPVDIVYEDRENRVHNEEDIVNIPVTQEARLQLINLELPQRAVMGEPVYIVADIANVGRVVLNNVMVSIEGDFPKENASYYFGQMQIGGSDYFEGTIIPAQDGELRGNLVLSYLDNTNQQITITEPFTLEVGSALRREEMMTRLPRDNVEGAGFSPEERSSSFAGKLPYLAAVLLLMAGGVIFWRRSRQNKEVEQLNERI